MITLEHYFEASTASAVYRVCWALWTTMHQAVCRAGNGPLFSAAKKTTLALLIPISNLAGGGSATAAHRTVFIHLNLTRTDQTEDNQGLRVLAYDELPDSISAAVEIDNML